MTPLSLIKASSLLMVLLINTIISANELNHKITKIDDWNSIQAHKVMKDLANSALKGPDEVNNPIDKIALLSLFENHDGVLSSIAQWPTKTINNSFHYQLYSTARLIQKNKKITFEAAFTEAFLNTFKDYDDKQAFKASWHQGYDLKRGISYLNHLFAMFKADIKPDPSKAIHLIKEYQQYITYKNILPLLHLHIKNDHEKRFDINENIIIKTPHGAIISGLMVKKRAQKAPLPTALVSTIYSDLNNNRKTAIEAAIHGYIGLVADTRGKRLSPDDIVPYEYDGIDTHAVIDWISKQKWSDGRVGMYGGSYSGFVQWAAAKYQHPALKTIVPYVAAIPGLGLPMENNVFLTANYAWPFFVTNNKYLDNDLYNDNQRWQQLSQKWYESGRPFREIDQIDGLDNPWLQKHLNHPAYDRYWQNMVPYQHDFSKIDIPVLSITGYYDDGQISALHYLNEHEKYHKNPNHHLIIGPYDHFGAQSIPAQHLRGYEIDQSAKIDVKSITFQWLDHIFYDKPKPKLIKDKINYQLMGADQWLTAPSLKYLNEQTTRFYFNSHNNSKLHDLTSNKPGLNDYAIQTIDFSDRQSSNNNYYPWPIIKADLNDKSGMIYITEPFKENHDFSGQFSGNISLMINKRDCDIGITVYEILPDGQAFHLGYFLGRASYAKDMSKRHLIEPDTLTNIPFRRSRMAAKLIKKGSRIAVVLDINKNSGAQINYGTGNDVSDESIIDANSPLVVKWFNHSYIDLPMKPIHEIMH